MKEQYPLFIVLRILINPFVDSIADAVSEVECVCNLRTSSRCICDCIIEEEPSALEQLVTVKSAGSAYAAVCSAA